MTMIFVGEQNRSGVPPMPFQVEMLVVVIVLEGESKSRV
jgi:hypothetical protein